MNVPASLWHLRGGAAPSDFQLHVLRVEKVSFAGELFASGLCTVVCTLKANGDGPGGAPCNGPSPLPSPCIQRGRPSALRSGVSIGKVLRSAARTSEAPQSTYPTTPQHRNNITCTMLCPDSHTYRMWTGIWWSTMSSRRAAALSTLRQPAASSKSAGWPSWASWGMLRKRRALGGVEGPLGRRETSL